MDQTNDSLFGLEFDLQAAAYITESAKWSRFLAIVWFVICGFIVLAALFAGSLIASLSGGVYSSISGSGLGASSS
ncbi:hypothetical protein [Paraflavitalea speifideaquila]|uniref:hypothetical protein n=1 Tax=Paraflavitalea speifideaquila TaxID=3076558 RepID=UPI0028E3F89A|nr:hypothetical protein [Paraflavitalea speifideiaquila]